MRCMVPSKNPDAAFSKNKLMTAARPRIPHPGTVTPDRYRPTDGKRVVRRPYIQGVLTRFSPERESALSRVAAQKKS